MTVKLAAMGRVNIGAKEPSDIWRPERLSGFPCWAIGYPSKVVIIAEGVPGILSKIALIRPPPSPGIASIQLICG